MKNEGAVGELIDRYVYQVVKRLPQGQREDIEKELRGLIDDMLSARSENPTKEDVVAVLRELGTPFELAAKYRGTGRYLIGPEYYALYELILKIAVAATAFGMALAQIISNIVTPPMNIFSAIGMFFGSIFMGVVQAFAWVTGIFALIERFAKGKFPDSEKWNPSDLPPVPEQRAIIKRSEPIVGIAFAILWIALIVSVPQLFSVYIGSEAVIPVFDLAALPGLLPLVVLIAVIGIVKELLRLVEGRYTIRLAIATAVLGAVSLVLFIVVFGGPIWNPDFAASISEVWGGHAMLQVFWRVFPKVLAGLAAFGYVVETITAFVRGAQSR